MSSNTLQTVLSEREGETGSTRQYVKVIGEGGKIVCVDSNLTSPGTQLRNAKQLFSSIFLPQGYPSSVSDDYIEYQMWDTIQAFASSLSYSLSTKAVLEGVGVGNVSSTPLAATLMWLIKDGTGMVGRIMFAWCNGTKLDADSKKWRFFADVLNDCALALELGAPSVVAAIGGSSTAMTGILCISGAAKSIVGVAGGATRAALTQHQARQGNLADVSAKDGSQETMVNLAALITSLWLLPLLDDSLKMSWLAFCVFTLLHVFANLKAVRAVTMQTLNRTRFLMVLKEYAATKKVPSVKETNQQEPFLMGLVPSDVDVCGMKIELGSTIKDQLDEEALENQLSFYSNRNFAVIPNKLSKTIYVIYRQGVTSEEMLESYSHAVVSAMLVSGQSVQGFTKFGKEADISSSLKQIANSSFWVELRQGLVKQGWNLEQSLLAAGEWRASW